MQTMIGVTLQLTLLSTFCFLNVVAFWINEIHYRNTGPETNEFIEIAAKAGTNLAGSSLVLYDGWTLNRKYYDTIALTGIVTDETAGFGFEVFHPSRPSDGIENGIPEPDGIALVDSSGAVVEFLSHGGEFVAKNGPADNMTSVDIGVIEEWNNPRYNSLQRVGTGSQASDFTWFKRAMLNTSDHVNTGQTLVAVSPSVSTTPSASPSPSESSSSSPSPTSTPSPSETPSSTTTATASLSATPSISSSSTASTSMSSSPTASTSMSSSPTASSSLSSSPTASMTMSATASTSMSSSPTASTSMSSSPTASTSMSASASVSMSSTPSASLSPTASTTTTATASATPSISASASTSPGSPMFVVVSDTLTPSGSNTIETVQTSCEPGQNAVSVTCSVAGGPTTTVHLQSFGVQPGAGYAGDSGYCAFVGTGSIVIASGTVLEIRLICVNRSFF